MHRKRLDSILRTSLRLSVAWPAAAMPMCGGASNTRHVNAKPVLYLKCMLLKEYTAETCHGCPGTFHTASRSQQLEFAKGEYDP